MSALNMQPAKKLFEQASVELGIEAAVIEKDWYVVQVLAAISSMQHPGFDIVFSGGTALSKAHKLLQRFSEDIDFRVIAADHTLKRTALSKFKHSVVAKLREAGFPIEDKDVRAQDGNRFFAVDIQYNTHFTRADALRPHIQLEVSINSPKLPAVQLPVWSFISDLKQEPAEVSSIACLSAVENAADKLSALAWRIADRVRGDQYDDPAIVRHIHDLAILEPIAIADPQFIALVRDAVSRDGKRAKNNIALNGMSIHEKFALMLDILENDKEYHKEYDRFVHGVSYAEEGAIPEYWEAVETLRKMLSYTY